MTNTSDLHDLIHADIDGTASPADRARLRELLAANPQAQDDHRRLSALREVLARVAPEAPPEPLRARIMRAVRAEKARRAMGFWQRVAPSWLSGRAVLPFAYAAAAGAMIGIVSFQILTGQGSSDAIERDAAATIGSKPAGTEAGHVTLAGAGVAGSATLRKIDATLALDVDLPTSTGLDVRVAYDPAAVKFIGVSNRTGGVSQLEVADGAVRWHAASPERVSLFFTPQTGDSSQVNVSFNTGAGSGSAALGLPGRD
jgi:anti-sigma factor RsiW